MKSVITIRLSPTDLDNVLRVRRAIGLPASTALIVASAASQGLSVMVKRGTVLRLPGRVAVAKTRKAAK